MISIVVFIVGLLIGIPIAFVLGLTGSVQLFTTDITILTTIPQRLFVTAVNYGLLAIPLFILTGDLMAMVGDVKRLLDFARALIGEIKGGLCYVMIILGAMLGTLLGSSNAEAALLSASMFEEMKQDGYEDTFIANLIASVSVIGPLIPPGMLLIIYGVASGVSIKDMFLSGIMAGIYVAIALAFVVFIKGRNANWPRTEWKGWGNVWVTFKEAFLSMLVPIVVFIAIIFGIATPTESAAIAAGLILIKGVFIYKNLSLKEVINVFVKTGTISGAVLIIATMGSIMGWVIALEQVPQLVTTTVLSLTNNPLIVLLMINILLLFVGMIMDATPAVMILVPVFMPIIKEFGFNPVHFGLMMCFNLGVGLLTPPVGTVLYTTSMGTKVPVDTMMKTIWPWVFVLFAVLMFITYVPDSVLFIPRLFGK